ncbi:MAG: DUF4926 domain-containing protein [Nitrospirota bacterium]
MSFKLLECVVLVHDVPAHGLKAGDLGTVVEVYPKGGLEIEFVTCSGDTQALVTLDQHDVRKVDAHDLLAARHMAA